MRFSAAGAALAMLGVLAGAFGAHALRSQISPQSLAIYQTGVQYHLFHAIALVALGAYRMEMRLSSWLFVIGIVVFSGSLYALAVTGASWLGAITPLGGLSFIVGWAVLALRLLKANSGLERP